MSKWFSSLSPKKQRIFLYILAGVVAFCSIIYELLLAEFLTTLYGNSVARYSTTIGLYLFSLGLGSFAYKYLNPNNHQRNLFIIEILLAIISVVSLYFLIILNTFYLSADSMIQQMYFLLSHLPIIIIGFLSGFELPIISSLISSTNERFSDVLGFDYVGSLIGTLIYALVFFPQFGLFITMIIIASFNVVVACLLVFLYWSVLKRFLLFAFFVFGVFSFLLYYSDDIDSSLQDIYIQTSLEFRYGNSLDNTIEILDYTKTKYQQFVHYNSGDRAENCFTLNNHIQGCDSWNHEYHMGLSGVAPHFFEDEEVSILILGGGDWILANYLQDSNHHIDLVDIDKEFVELTKTHEYTSKYHDNSFENDQLEFIHKDALDFLRTTSNSYDMIFLDLPGLLESTYLSLYSKEFFYFLQLRLNSPGVITTWVYDLPDNDSSQIDYINRDHHDIFYSTIKDVGFSTIYTYSAYNRESGYPIEKYIMLTKGFNETLNIGNEDLSEIILTDSISPKFLDDFSFKEESNSIFKPRHDMIVKR